jgi:hypothetical protein
MDRLQRSSDKCQDCQCDNPTMHNSREVNRWGGISYERGAGYLCYKCWVAANPVLMKEGSATRSSKSLNPAVIVWLLFALCVICGAIASYLAK